MKSKIYYPLFLNFCLFFGCLNLSAQHWTPKSSFPGPGTEFTTTFSIDSLGYVALGANGNYLSTGVWQYDAANDVWTQVADFPGINGYGLRQSGVGFSINGKGYLCTGYDGSGAPNGFQNDLWQFDPVANTWAQKSSLPAGGRFAAMGFSFGDRAYVGGGLQWDWNSSSYYSSLNDFWEYDPATDSWTQKANIPGLSRGGAISFTIGNTGYIGAGAYQDEHVPYATPLTDFYAYDTAADVWTPKANTLNTAQYSVSFSLAGKGYIGLGYTGLGDLYGYEVFESITNNIYQYDPVADAWSPEGIYPGAGELGNVGLNINNIAYIGLGFNATISAPEQDFWQMTPCNGSDYYPGITVTGSTGICYGDTVTLTADYTGSYLWSSGETSQSISVFNIGPSSNGTSTYEVVDPDSSTCISAANSVTVTSIPASYTIANGSSTFCIGDSVTLIAVSYSIGLHSYLWSTGDTTASITVYTSGLYTVSVDGCAAAIDTNINLVTVTPGCDALTAGTAVSAYATVCTGSYFSLYLVGATPCISSYQWQSSPDNVNFTDIDGGLYSDIAVAQDSSAYYRCFVTCNNSTAYSTVVFVSTPTYIPTITVGGFDTLCYGSSVTLTANTNSSYYWSDGETTQSITVTNYNYYVPQLFYYSVINPDSNSCISQNNSVSIFEVPQSYFNIYSGDTAFCSGDSAILFAFAPYYTPGNYLWSTGDNTQFLTVKATGLYSVTVDGCPAIDAFTNDYTPIAIDVNSSLYRPTIMLSGPDSICYNSSITLTAGGAGPYSWSTGDTTQSITVINYSKNYANTLYYSVINPDSNSCVSSANSVSIFEKPPFITEALGNTSLCLGDSVTIEALSNGYNYTPGTYLWNTGATTASIVVSTSGTYSAIVDGCNTFEPVTVSVNTATYAPSITANGSTTLCYSDSIVLTASKSSSYLWSIGGVTTQSITLFDGDPYNDQYIISVIDPDSGSCVFQNNSIILNTTAVSYIVSSASGTGAIRQGDSVVLTAYSYSTGTPSYSWSTGDTTQSITVKTSGNYNVTVDGCPSFETLGFNDITVTPGCDALTGGSAIASSGTSQTCAGDLIQLSLNGATACASSYDWQSSADNVTYTDLFFPSSMSIATQQSASTYYRCAVSCGGDTVYSTPVLVVTATYSPTLNYSGLLPLCSGNSVTLTANPNSHYLWNTGDTTQSITVDSILPETYNSYSVVNPDSNSCVPSGGTNSVIVYDPSVTLLGSPTSFCSGDSAIIGAELYFTISNFLWNDGETTPSITVYTPGTYSAIVDGCPSLDSVTITVYPGCDALTGGTPVANPTYLCSDNNYVFLSLTNYTPCASTYEWQASSDNVTFNDIFDLYGNNGPFINTYQFGTTYYRCIVGCGGATAYSAVVTVTVDTTTISSSGPITFCGGDSVTLTASSGSGYLWSTGQTTQSITVSTSGRYGVAVNGCNADSAINVVVSKPPTVSASGPSIVCTDDTIQLKSTAISSSYAIDSISYAPVKATGNTTVLAYAGFINNSSGFTGTLDEGYWAGITLPFNFHFFGNSYSSINIGTDGIIQFGPQNQLPVSFYQNYPIPSTAGYQNYIGIPTADLDFDNPNSKLEYFVAGTAPNRKFVINSFGSTFGNQIADTSQVILYEGSDIIEVHMGAQISNSYGFILPLTLGIENADGSIGYSPANRNDGYWYTLAGEAWRFDPSVTYQWSGPKGFTSATQNPVVVNATPADTGVYTVTVTDPAGCSSSSSVKVNIDPNARPTITAQGPTTFCQGEDVVLKSSKEKEYLWTTGATTRSIDVRKSGTYNVSAGGCSALTPVVVTVKPSPTITASGALTFCTGDSVVLTASAGGKYLWNTGATTQSITVKKRGLYNVYVDGCPSRIPVSVNVEPVPTISVCDENLCPGEETTLTASAGHSYLWSNGKTTRSIEVSHAGTYSVTVDGCASLPVTITVSCQAPDHICVSSCCNKNKISIHISWSQSHCSAEGYEVQYKEKGTQNWTTVSVNGDRCNSADINGLSPGNYYEFRVRSKCGDHPDVFSDYSETVEYYVNNDCAHKSATVENSSTDGNDIAAIYDFVLYPNPTSDQLHVTFSATEGEAEIRVVDVVGKTVLTRKITSTNSYYKTDIDVSALPAGVYIINAQIGDASMNGRFVKQ